MGEAYSRLATNNTVDMETEPSEIEWLRPRSGCKLFRVV